MNFADSIFNELGINQCAPTDYRATVYSDYAIYFENIKGIKSYSENEIELYTKKNVIKVTGENISIKRFALSDIILTGKIYSFGVEK